MPLSEHEQRILADIEARLRADDPRFAESVGSASVSGQLRGRIKLDVLGFLVGFALLFVGIRVNLLWGVLGFGLMLATAYHGLTIAKKLAGDQAAADGDAPRTPLQRYLGGSSGRDDEDR